MQTTHHRYRHVDAFRTDDDAMNGTNECNHQLQRLFSKR